MRIHTSNVCTKHHSYRKESPKRRQQLLSAVTIQFAVTMTCSAAEGPALPSDLITQEAIRSGAVTTEQIRAAGKLVYTTPYNTMDGLGDGPSNSSKDRTALGNRPRIQNLYTPFLRVNGLDAQTCLECHSVLSRATVPMTFAPGGHGGLNNSPIFMPKQIDVDGNDSSVDGVAYTDGRFINPLFNFGGGGVELVAKEMTAELQRIKAKAKKAVPGTKFALIAKGVSFGKVISNGNGKITFKIDGKGHAIDEDLVVRAFGRKGEFSTIRDFDRGAMEFHFGIQPSEVVGENIDADGDGVFNEITPGEMSALSIFLASLPPPKMASLTAEAKAGEKLFKEIGCARCHVPELQTESATLTHSFPEVATSPSKNTFHRMDMSETPMKFPKTPNGAGIRVMMFSDLKRHDMGPGLAETTGNKLDGFFITARLWGIADSAPYLHDGRALTLKEAILAHGGEAQKAKEAYQVLGGSKQEQLLSFLRSLRLPTVKELDKLFRQGSVTE